MVSVLVSDPVIFRFWTHAQICNLTIFVGYRGLTVAINMIVVSDVPFEEVVSRFGGTPESAIGQQLETDTGSAREDSQNEY